MSVWDDPAVERLAIIYMIDAGIFPKMDPEEAEGKFRRLNERLRVMRLAFNSKVLASKRVSWMKEHYDGQALLDIRRIGDPEPRAGAVQPGAGPGTSPNPGGAAVDHPNRERCNSRGMLVTPVAQRRLEAVSPTKIARAARG